MTAKTKKTEQQLKEFVEKVEELRSDLLNEKQGYILFAYDEVDDKSQNNTFSFSGKFNCFAECLFTCMKSNPTLANLVLAASSAVAQSRVVEMNEQMQQNTPKETTNKPKIVS